jgi:hypothetical protein
VRRSSTPAGRDLPLNRPTQSARPHAYLLTLLRHRTLDRKDFAETARGACRIRPTLASQLAETLPTWRTNIAPTVERVAQTLADNGPTRLDVPTSLTGADRRASWHARRPRAGTKAACVPPLPSTCRGCGSQLPSRARRYCDGCRRASAERAGHTARAAAATALERLRDGGRDPAHGGDAAKRRGRRTLATNRRSPSGNQTPARRTTPKSFDSGWCRNCASGR